MKGEMEGKEQLGAQHHVVVRELLELTVGGKPPVNSEGCHNKKLKGKVDFHVRERLKEIR